MATASQASASISFGRFEVSPHRRELLADGRPVKLGGRAFDVLMALIEVPGAVIDKDALMRRVWPDRIVEENNLQVQISALRAAFGKEPDIIRTVAGRGYQFTGQIGSVSPASDEHTAAARIPSAPAQTNLPEPISELIGRDAEMDEIVGMTATHRLVTLAGAGGVGKTRLALAVARRRMPDFVDGVWLVEFSPLSDPGLVPATVAAAVGLKIGGGEPSAQRLGHALADRRMLLVLDTCEHVIDAAAALAEAVLLAGPAVRIIATSREPLRVQGEWVYLVPPLAVPPEDSWQPDDAQQYGAVRLFLERSQAVQPRFAPNQRLAAMIPAICRRLDGIPLAIELAAACTTAFGIEDLLAGLDDRFHLLIDGRRTALPRHQTLRATLDWSYERLPETERIVLRRLAVFAGYFNLTAASAVLSSAEMTSAAVIDAISGLVAKSLLAAKPEGSVLRYRLLDTTRAYAFEKLAEGGELQAPARRHAEFYRDLFERAEAETRPIAEWLADYGSQIDNLRAALDWAFAPNGDAQVGVALTAAAVPVWMHLSLLGECRDRVERALRALDGEATRDARREMKLHAALGASLLGTGEATSPEIGAAGTKALEIAEILDDAEYQSRALWGLWAFQLNSGRPRLALPLAQRFSAMAANRPDPNDRLIGERMVGVTRHYMGDQKSARSSLERVLAEYRILESRSHIIGFHIDLQVAVHTYLSRILWLQGFPDQAMRIARDSLEDAGAADHANSQCYCLTLAACPIALLVGDLIAAERYVTKLLDYSTRHSLTRWRAYGRSYQGALVIKRGNLLSGLQLLRGGLVELGEERGPASLLELPMAEAFGQAGQIATGLAKVDEAIDHFERNDEGWMMPELRRVRGELLLLQDDAPKAAAVAEHHFRQALDEAGRQGALSWELRAAMSLARLLRNEARSGEAKAVLQPVYDRFTEGFDTADLKAAKALINVLR